MSVTAETATVYRAGGRRWLTAKAAYRAEAKSQLRSEHGGCDCTYEPDTGYSVTCDYHSLPSEIINARAKALARATLAADGGPDERR